MSRPSNRSSPRQAGSAPGKEAPERSVEPAIKRLEELLHGQLADFRELLECLQLKRQAIRVADLDALNETSRREQRVATRCGQREPQRRELLQTIARVLVPEQASLTIGELAERLEEPSQSRLLALAAQLREVASTTRTESSVVRHAAEALSRHLGGVMQTMQTALGRAQVYGERGRLAGAQVKFSVDVKS